jgi:hypothetical protein
MKRFSARFWLELVLAGTSLVLLLLTLMWRDWIELVFGADPDHGDGSLEWLIVAMAAVATVVFGVLARLEWRHLRARAAAR